MEGTATGSRESEPRLLRALFDRLPAMVAYWDQDARNVIANAAYVEWFGYRPEEMRGLHISEVLGAEVYAKNRPFIDAALAGEEQLFDRTLVDQLGRTRHTQASYVPDKVGDEVHGFFVLVTDVTPRVEAQRRMDEAQALARLGSWELATETGEVSWSRELYRIVGLSPDEAKPTLEALSVHLHPDDRERVLDNIAQASRSAEPYTISYRIVTADGSVREVVSSGQPVIGPDGRVVRLTGTLQDVTESNAAARALAQANEGLRRANQLNADVIAMLGHDVCTPVAALRGCIDFLDDEWDDLSESERRSLVSRSRSVGVRLGAMVGQIQSLAAVDSGEIAPQCETVDLESALAAIAQYVPGGRGAVPVRLGIGVPATVDFDPVHLEQIVGNLLTNAFRYGAEPVEVLVDRDGDAVTIAVTDAGPGVPDPAVPALFDRFGRTGDRQRAAGGLGFGLYMADQLARANGATLTYRRAADPLPHAFVLTVPTASGDLSDC